MRVGLSWLTITCTLPYSTSRRCRPRQPGLYREEAAMSFHGYHHITSTVTNAKRDHAFHVGLLGLRNVKRTVLLDGSRPFYHLYYGNELGNPGTLLTSFVFDPD